MANDRDARIPVAMGAEDRLARMAQIADGSDQDDDHKDLEDYLPDDASNQGDALEGFRDDEQAPAEKPSEPSKGAEERRFKLKVNGKEMEVSEQELIARAQKVESADDYLRQAAELRRVAEQSTTQNLPARVDDSAAVSDDVRNIARAVQMGTEEEATQAIARLMRPSVNTDDVLVKVMDRVRFENDAEWFQDEYEDVFKDDLLRELAITMDEKAVRQGDRRPYRERYSDIGDKIRARFGISPSLDQKQERKAAASPPLRQAAARSAQGKTQEDDEDISDSEVIRRMARARNQNLP